MPDVWSAQARLLAGSLVILPRLADAIALLAALACWRVSRPSALALLGAFAASLLYLVAPWEPLRWVSAAVGLVGVIEFVRGFEMLRVGVQYVRFMRERRIEMRSPWRVILVLPRRAWIGLLLFASMAGDGAALIAYRTWQEWVLPVAQIVVCAAIAAIARWPERDA